MSYSGAAPKPIPADFTEGNEGAGQKLQPFVAFCEIPNFEPPGN